MYSQSISFGEDALTMEYALFESYAKVNCPETRACRTSALTVVLISVLATEHRRSLLCITGIKENPAMSLHMP